MSTPNADALYVEPCRDPESVDGICVKQPECHNRCQRRQAQIDRSGAQS